MLINGGKDHVLTEEERARGREKARESHRKKKDLKVCLQALLETEITDKNGNTLTGSEALATKAFQEALKGNTKFWELVRDTSGQKPVEKVMVAEVEQSTLDEIEDLVAESKKGE